MKKKKKKQMTLRMFLNRLRKIRENGWKVSRKTDALRLTCPSCNQTSIPLGKSSCFCPITAICFDNTGVFFNDTSFRTAARKIGLPWSIAHLVARSSDNERSLLTHNPRLMYDQDADEFYLLRKMCQALGLRLPKNKYIWPRSPIPLSGIFSFMTSRQNTLRLCAG